MSDVIGTQTRWGAVVAVGFIAGERYVWCEQTFRAPGRSFREVPVVSMLPYWLVFPVDTTRDTDAGASDVAQIQDDATSEATS